MNEWTNEWIFSDQRSISIFKCLPCLCQDMDYGLQELLVAPHQQRDVRRWSDILITTFSSNHQMPLGHDDWISFLKWHLPTKICYHGGVIIFSKITCFETTMVSVPEIIPSNSTSISVRGMTSSNFMSYPIIWCLTLVQMTPGFTGCYSRSYTIWRSTKYFSGVLCTDSITDPYTSLLDGLHTTLFSSTKNIVS